MSAHCKDNFLSWDPSKVATSGAIVAGTGAGAGRITAAGTYYSYPTQLTFMRDVSDVISFTGTLAGTLTAEVSNNTEAEDLKGTSLWTQDTTITLPGIAVGTAARVPDTDPLVFELSSGTEDLTAVVATEQALPACTAAGSGVGKTLTANAVGVLVIDGVTIALNDLVLVKNQANQVDNGFYKCTTAGTGGVAFVLTRDIGFDQSAETTPGKLIKSTGGTLNAGTKWLLDGTAQSFGAKLPQVSFARYRLKFVWSSGKGSVTSYRAMKGI